METMVDGERVVMSGTAVISGAGELRAADGKGTRLVLVFDRQDESSQTGGSLHDLSGHFPTNTPGRRHVYGFGAGEGDKMHSVRIAVEEVLHYKVVTYTVTANF